MNSPGNESSVLTVMKTNENIAGSIRRSAWTKRITSQRSWSSDTAETRVAARCPSNMLRSITHCSRCLTDVSQTPGQVSLNLLQTEKPAGFTLGLRVSRAAREGRI